MITKSCTLLFYILILFIRSMKSGHSKQFCLLFCLLLCPVLDLPVDRCQSVCLQKHIRLAEMLTSEKAAVCRERTWMRCFQDQMLWIIVQHRFFHLCRSAPQQKDHRAVLLIQDADGCIGKFFPSNPPVGICLMCTHGENRVQQQYALFRPFRQIPIIRDITATVIVQFFINIYKRRRYLYIWFHRKTKSMCLSIPMVRVLP